MAYNITPSLRGVATVNTDFAETEVDERLVNLTRFPLFLPERRTFFLDGATFFDFPIEAFFSRRIGLVDGQPQPIVGGGKLTGQAGRFDTGALYVRTAETDIASAEDFLVGRVRRRMLQQSYVGAIYTARNTYDGLDRGAQQTAGVDFRLATATFRRNKNLNLTGYWVANSTFGNLGDSAAFGANVEYPNDIWEAAMDFQEVQPNYDPAVGFTPRQEFRRYNPYITWNPRPKTRHRFIRRLGFGIDPEVITDLENRKQSLDLEVQPFRLEAHSGDNVEVSISPSYERLDEPFEIATGITLPPGSYDFMRYSIEANTANRRVVALRPRVEWGTFFNGDRTEYLARPGRPAAPGRPHQHYVRVQRRRPRRRQLRHDSAAHHHRHAVQPVHVPDQQRPVRLGERGARLAVALPLDSPPRQRHLLRLHTQLGGQRRSAGPAPVAIPHAGSAQRGEGGLHEALLSRRPPCAGSAGPAARRQAFTRGELLMRVLQEWIVDSLGIPVTPIGPELRKATASSPPATPGPPSPDRRRQLADATVATQFETIAAAAQGCDIIVAATALQIAARSVAEKMGIPYVFAAYCPTVLPSPHAQRVISGPRNSP